ncbi:glycosyltransferase [bacterium]|nr:glycosyltransferase [bacterium]
MKQIKVKATKKSASPAAANCQKTSRSCPRIDVFLPVYNASKYLRQALDSIIAQTYTNWRLFACDDASTDNSWEILKEYAARDPRINIMRNKTNLRNGANCERLLKYCTSQYIAKMDADDISLPDRFAKQLKYLQDNPDVIAVGGQCLLIDKKGRIFGEKKFLTDPERVYQSMFTTVPAQFPAVMFNSHVAPDPKTWYIGIHHSICDDVGLFFNISRYGKITNLPDYVLKYRIHSQNSTLVDPKATFKITWKQRLDAIKTYNYKPTLRAWLTNIAQFVAVSIIPNRLIVPLFYFTKGVKIS